MSDDDPDAYRETVSFLERHSEGDAIVDAALSVDSNHETWTFEDVDLDSGQFGELASTGILERVDGEYRLRDRDAVVAALDGDGSFERGADTAHGSIEGFVPDVSFRKRELGALLGALLVAFLIRVWHLPSVYQGGRVVSPGNDPYFFRYWQERLVSETAGPLSFEVLVNPPWETAYWNQRPLTHATNWWLTELLGGGQWAADFVAAWQPVAFTLLLLLVLYRTAVVLTGDARVGVVSVLVVGLAPIHVGYTGLGLFHHRSHQFLWFGVALLGLVWLARDLTERRASDEGAEAVRDRLSERRTWAVCVVFGLGLGLYTHSWGGSAEVYVPLVGYLGLRTVLDVRADLPPAASVLPTLVGVVLGTAVTVTLHVLLGWHSRLAPVVAVLAAVSAVGVVALGEFWHRRSLSSRHLLFAQFALVAGALGALVAFVPAVSRLVADSFGLAILSPGRSSQATSLFSLGIGLFRRPLFDIGVTFYVGLVGLVWGLSRVRTRYCPGWLAFVVFGLGYLVAAAIRVRFAARLVVVLAVFAGLGIVLLLAKLDVARTPVPLDDPDPGSARRSIGIPDPGDGAYVAATLVLVFGLSVPLSPTVSGDVLYDDAQVETALAIADHAAELDLDYPDSYVFARWGNDRMYNYFVSGNSRDETYARGGYGDRGYMSFIAERDPDEVVSELPGEHWNVFENGTGYVVVTDRPGSFGEGTVQSRLYHDGGLGTDEYEALSRYRIVHVSDGGAIVAYQIVPGARLEISSQGDGTVHVSRNVTVSGRSFTYERTVAVNGSQTASVTVPYAGTYKVNGVPVVVPESAVMRGRAIRVPLAPRLTLTRPPTPVGRR